MSESTGNENHHIDNLIDEDAKDERNSESSATAPSSIKPSGTEIIGSNVHVPYTLTNPQEVDHPSRPGPNGARSKHGKGKSSRNAIKFGIFSKVTLIRGESRAEFESLRKSLMHSMRPGDEVEELLVDKIASNYWRQRRALVAESAEIQIRTLEIVNRESTREIMSICESEDLISRVLSPEGLKHCLEILAELRERIQANGFDEKQDRALLREIYGDPTGPYFRNTLYDKYLILLETARVTEEERAHEEYPPPEYCRAVVLCQIEVEVAKLKKRYQRNEKRESIETEKKELEILRQQVPDSPGLDRLLRYLNNLERSLDRMLTQYERAQRLRMGQPLPPRLELNVM